MNSLLVGNIGTNPTPLVLAGGNCSIQGFDSEGNDEFWTVRRSVTLLFIKDASFPDFYEMTDLLDPRL